MRYALLCFIIACSAVFSLPASAQENPTATRFGTYAVVPLTMDTSDLTNDEKQMVRLLIEAAEQMDAIFWKQAYGDKAKLLGSIDDPDLNRYAQINYGPWDRLNGDKPFIEGVGEKPLGANFYPKKMTVDKFNKYLESNPEQADAMKSLYTVVRWKEGKLRAVPYHTAYKKQVEKAAKLLDQAAELAPQESLAEYLTARAEALRTDEYQASDLLWMDMKDNRLDVVIGPDRNV